MALNLEGFGSNLQPLLDGCLSLALSHTCLSLATHRLLPQQDNRSAPSSALPDHPRTLELKLGCSDVKVPAAQAQGKKPPEQSSRAENTSALNLHSQIHQTASVRPSFPALLHPCHCHISPQIWLPACSKKQILHPQALLPQSPREREAASVMNAQRERDLCNSGITE